MADNEASNLARLEPVQKFTLIPVTLKEAALDSPSFRAVAYHFSEQIGVVEVWLDNYIRAAQRLVQEVSSLEGLVNNFIAQSTPPNNISEAVLDPDHSLLAMKRYGEGAREFWNYTLRGVKKYEQSVIDPIRGFLERDLRIFKDARRSLEATQKTFDSTVSRYLSQSKSKESSSLREDAFQLHESRKAYLKASMDYCAIAPQLRAALDKLIVRIFSEQWKEMRASREANNTLFQKWSTEIERVRGWSHEMENSEGAFKKELMLARKQLEEAAESKARPSRELDDYAISTVPYLGTGGPRSQPGLATPAKPPGQGHNGEKQGWLFMRTLTGKPARTVWSRRWFYVQNGIFGWLIQGNRSGGVEESDKYGVLLCSVRPAFQEDRRFCFEVKTKDQSIVLQAETQGELVEWIDAFEVAKRNALDDPASTDAAAGVAPGTFDPAFSISPPTAPEFAAKPADGHSTSDSQDGATGLGLAAGEAGAVISSRPSFDVRDSAARRVMSLSRDPGPESSGDGERGRDHAARLMQKLDLHKRSTAASPALTQTTPAPPAGGIASLISASHNILPVGPGAMSPPQALVAGSGQDASRRGFIMPLSTLAPSTLVNPPAPTNLSHTAVVVSGERGVSFGGGEKGVPSGIMANLWGSVNWGYINRVGGDGGQEVAPRPGTTGNTGTANKSLSINKAQDDSGIMDGHDANLVPQTLHRKTASLQAGGSGITSGKASLDASALPRDVGSEEEFPSMYPLPLKAQQAQFGMLFPTVPKTEKVLLVFRATWNPNEQQEFPGRVYVTIRNIYFYSHHMGLVLITSVALDRINEITAAPGRDCDFLYLHLRPRVSTTGESEEDRRRITVKTFLEPLKLLQRRLSYLVHNANSDEPDILETALRTLIKLEVDVPKRSSSADSWEDLTFSNIGDSADSPEQRKKERNLKASLHIDSKLGYKLEDRVKTGREVQKFKLPAHPVVYAPKDLQSSVVREFNVSAKALFHVMFGDKSAVFQLLYANRWADNITQTPWTQSKSGDGKEKVRGKFTRRFTSPQAQGPGAGSFQDTQTIDIHNDHLCYVVSNTKRPWRLPYSQYFTLVTKLVITHSAKSKCKLALYQQIVWQKTPMLAYFKHLIEVQSFKELEANGLDLTNVVMDQVGKLGHHSKTNRAVEIFGNIGQQTQIAQIDTSKAPTLAVLGGTKQSRLAERRTLSVLIAQDAFTRVISLVTMVLDLVIAIGKGLLNACTTHTLLVILLVTSTIYNSWHSYRDGLVWWHEREAGKYMKRLGVMPQTTLHRAIYLHDVDELIKPPFLTGSNVTDDTLSSMLAPDTTPETGVKSCRSTFAELIGSPSDDSDLGSNAPGSRLHRTRDSIARYRHDLLVAIRVINRVEKHVVAAEWEDWVVNEGKKCTKVKKLLLAQHASEDSKSKKGKTKGKDQKQADDAALADLGDDFQRYCESCRLEGQKLQGINKLM
ncbi:hypothetical protein K431DRAFT_272765 [Polychaeton citri CBS 116435]|uniref:Transcription factor SipA3 n=1 Tax=Polychaeton citri CBS 116435 TaxID=1314669 RepID=A0A9P4UMD0_9PEZI|nr:hypothetical protein K431DRAFT_272765 [Polychaeton citri CBS 116435]